MLDLKVREEVVYMKTVDMKTVDKKFGKKVSIYRKKKV